jgi:hypothetical protein
MVDEVLQRSKEKINFVKIIKTHQLILVRFFMKYD